MIGSSPEVAKAIRRDPEQTPEDLGEKGVSLQAWVLFKSRAALTLFRMIRWLSNWTAVWSPYRASSPLPPLRFRSGLTLHHGPLDSPIALLHEVFGEGQYRRHINAPNDGVMVDLGANIGAVTLDWGSRSSGLRIHAYEPNPSANTMLRQNIAVNGLNDRVTVYDESVGRESGSVRLWTNVNSMTSTVYGETPPERTAVPVHVPQIDLNEVVRRAGGHVSLLKIDTEGAEADTLEGASTATLRSVEQIVLEYHVRLCPDVENRCKSALETAGFRCRVRRTNAFHGLMYAWRDD